MSNYPGNPTWWTAFPLLSDAVKPKASDLNVPLQSLGDRTAYLKSRADALEALAGRQVALNFRRVVVSGVGQKGGAVYNRALRAWVVVGRNALVKAATDGVDRWSASSIVSVGVAGEHCLSADCDVAGNMVVTTQTRYLYQLATSPGSPWSAWTKVDVWGGVPPGEVPAKVVYDPVHGRWVWFAAPEAGAHKFKYSTNRTTWTAATTPPVGVLWDQDYASFVLGCHRATGRVVAMAQRSVGAGDSILVATSDDGGVTWTNQIEFEALTHTFGDKFNTGLTCDESTGAWTFVQSVTYSSGARKSRVYRSTNGGVSWVLKSTLSAASLTSIAQIGDLLVGVASIVGNDDEVVWSTDQGATWHLAGINTSWGDPSVGVFAGGGGLVIPNNDSVYVSQRVGTPDLGVLA